MGSGSLNPATVKIKSSRRTLQCTWCSWLSTLVDGLEANSADRKNLQLSCHGDTIRVQALGCSVWGGHFSTSGRLSPCTAHGTPVCPALPLKAQL